MASLSWALRMKRGMRISVVLHYEGVSGALRSLRHRLSRLEPESELEFIVPGPGPARRELADLGDVSELEFSALTFPDSLFRARGHVARLSAESARFRRHFAESRPDLVITTSVMLPTVVRAAGKEGLPVLVHASELLSSERLPSASKRAAAGFLLRWTERRASLVVACSDAVAGQFKGGGAGVETLYPPIADDFADGDRGRLRERFGIGAEQPWVVSVGNITRGRGQDLLLRAFAKLRRRLPNARCLIVGEPFERERDLGYSLRLHNLANQLGISEAVDFVGAVEEMADVYAAADLVVNPARIPESFGRVGCEALLAGRPVISTRVGAVPEVLRDGESALLVEPDDPDQLAAGMLRLLTEPELAARLVANGRADVARRFAPESVAARFSRLVGETLAREVGWQPAEPPLAPATPTPHPAEAPALRSP
jgi:glycosyltransferase involved in cell wall biosynthesis